MKTVHVSFNTKRNRWESIVKHNGAQVGPTEHSPTESGIATISERQCAQHSAGEPIVTYRPKPKAPAKKK